MAREPNQRGNRRDRDETPEFADRLVAINRVSKTTKGGRNRIPQRRAVCSTGASDGAGAATARPRRR